MKYLIVFWLSLIYSITGITQTNSNCFSSFNLFTGNGLKNLPTCYSNYSVKCISKHGEVTQLINNVYGGRDGEKIKLLASDNSKMYSFPKTYLHDYHEWAFFLRHKSNNRYDTLLAKTDTLYFKKTQSNRIQVSKYYVLKNDTFSIKIYDYENDSKLTKLLTSFDNINLWGQEKSFSHTSEIHFVLNSTNINFISRIDSDSNNVQCLQIKDLNKIVQNEKVPPSLYWLCVIFRLLI
jgi:hypothetical protein